MRSNWLLALLWVGLGWLLSWPALAVEVPGLFNVDVPAADDSASERMRAEMAGLSEVLVRVSGKSSVLTAPAVTAALHNPESYVLQFSMAANSDGDPTRPRSFRFRFDPRAVTQLLKTNRLPIWSSNRPPLLIWCVDESGTLVARTGNGAWQQRVQQGAARRGVPVLWPLADGQDQAALKADDIAATAIEPINSASLRYIAGPGTGVVLAAKITNSGGWQARMVLLLDGKGGPIQIQAASETELAQRMMDYAADTIADRFALSLSSNVTAPGQMKLVVDNVFDYSTAAAVNDYLRRVTAIKSARLISVSGSSMSFALNLEGDIAQVKQAFQLDQKLTPADAVGSMDLTEMHFNWNARP
ncbi:MAG TPA: DUF2066 domain-containing protein [Pseudomonadales bacterium]|nr:DUF2066 domain-containing protein [Pseudomonadales bacterium]